MAGKAATTETETEETVPETPPQGAAPEPEETAEALVDPDDAELAEARAALEKATGADGEDETEEGEDADLPEETKADETAEADGSKGEGKPSDDEGKPEPIMIPKPRFDEALGEVRRAQAAAHQAMQAAAYYRGLAEAKNTGDDKSGQEGQGQPKDPRAEVREEILTLAEKYDQGEITTREYEARRLDLQDRLSDLSMAERLAKAPTAPPPSKTDGGVADLYLDERTAQLEADHPFSRMIPAGDPRWEFLTAEAARELQAENVVLDNGPRSALALRERMASLTDKYGPVWFPEGAPGAANGQIKGQNAAPADKGTETPPSMSDAARKRAAALERQGAFPPDVNRMPGGSAGGPDEFTPEQVASLSDEDIAELPAAARRRILQME